MAVGELVSNILVPDCQSVWPPRISWQSKASYKKAGKIMSCWICGAEADTREHIHKQTDVRIVFGKGPYKKGKRLQITSEAGKKKFIQSEASDHLKYQKSLCGHCNNTRTKPYDEAYTEFVYFIHEHAMEVLTNEKISLKKIYHEATKKKSKLLYKYYAKAFGCKLVKHGISVPAELVDCIRNPRAEPVSSLLLTFAIYDEYPEKQLGLKGLLMTQRLEKDTDRSSGEVKYTFAQSVAWLSVVYWYNHIINNNLGAPWRGSDKEILLGHIQ